MITGAGRLALVLALTCGCASAPEPPCERVRATLMPLYRYEVVVVVDGSAASQALRADALRALMRHFEPEWLESNAYDLSLTILSADLGEGGAPRTRPDEPRAGCPEVMAPSARYVTELGIDERLDEALRCLAPSRAAGPSRPLDALLEYLSRHAQPRAGAEFLVLVVSASSEPVDASVIEQLASFEVAMLGVTTTAPVADAFTALQSARPFIVAITTEPWEVLLPSRRLVGYSHFREPLLRDGACEVFERPGPLAYRHRCDELPGRTYVGGSLESGGEQCRLASPDEPDPQWAAWDDSVMLEYVWPGMIVELRCPLPDYACAPAL